MGSRKVVTGTYTNTAVTTGGDINTGLIKVEVMTLQGTGTAVNATSPVINETIPNTAATADDITLVTVAGGDGVFRAVGY